MLKIHRSTTTSVTCQVSKLVCGSQQARIATWTRSRVMMMKKPWHMLQDCTSSHRHEHSHARYDAGAANSQVSAHKGLVLMWGVWANLECGIELNDVLEVGMQLADQFRCGVISFGLLCLSATPGELTCHSLWFDYVTTTFLQGGVQCPGRFLGIIGQIPHFSRSNCLHVVSSQLSLSTRHIFQRFL
jgi:hypothetical protein